MAKNRFIKNEHSIKYIAVHSQKKKAKLQQE